MIQAPGTLFVILGVTGDLSIKKIIPAVSALAHDGRIGSYALIGVGRRQTTPHQLIMQAKPHMRDHEDSLLEDLEDRFTYVQGDFDREDTYERLAKAVQEAESRYETGGNRLFYLSTLPEYFTRVASAISREGLAAEGGGWKRVVFEKPFGHDARSAKQINHAIRDAFSEESIFRIDHYLGKELVQALVVTRFANEVLEPLWNRDHIDHVQIILSEKEGIEGRGQFYDSYGAIRDVVQNHLLQLLALTAMEAPQELSSGQIRDAKMAVLRMVRPETVVRAQYEGYRSEPNVVQDSATETFAAFRCTIANPRWEGVPFYLMTGKKLPHKQARIYVEFKQPPCRMLAGNCPVQPNYLLVQIQPDPGFSLQLNTKSPGTLQAVPVTLDFSHEQQFGANTPEAYENLLSDVISNDQSVFMRHDEIEEQWRIIDGIDKRSGSLATYVQGTTPPEAVKMMSTDGREWFIKT